MTTTCVPRFDTIVLNTQPMVCWMCDKQTNESYKVDGDVACKECATDGPYTIRLMTRVELQDAINSLNISNYLTCAAYREWFISVQTEFYRKTRLYDSIKRQETPSGA
jgi:hypothetical protein